MINNLQIKSSQSKKLKQDQNKTTTENKGIVSTLHNTCESSIEKNKEKNSNLINKISIISPDLHFIGIVNQNYQNNIKTNFGMMPEGSVLAIHAPIMQPNFKVYSNLKDITNMPIFNSYKYPSYPFNNNDCNLDEYLQKATDLKALKLIESLKINSDDINQIERLTRNQARCSLWFEKRNNHFTSSLCNKIKSVKGEKELKTQAYNIVFRKHKHTILCFEKHTILCFENTSIQYCVSKTQAYNIVFRKDKNIGNNIAQRKMNHGKFYKPIAISNYEKYLLSENHVVIIELCGLAIDKNNFILGATPDGKVQVFGIIEVKCNEEYKNVDPKDICFMSKNVLNTMNELN
ncbi:uncharacterized protein LOC101240241 isoform X7 [Hydra vulgaris]|uniref:Uncharacterized protein LOC101240241 isoform X7 n=1 Tax=Hydra vulgaris TaxID=6087 RepID=A0ABM4C515_HYDVU